MKILIAGGAGRIRVAAAFIVAIAAIVLSTSAYGQLKAASNSGTQSVSPQPVGSTPQAALAAKEPSCTSEASTSGNAQHERHNVALSWKASTSAGVVGYNVYRRIETSDKFTKINDKPVSTTDCVDYSVLNGKKYYYYVVTADRPGVRESDPSNIAPAEIPQ